MMRLRQAAIVASSTALTLVVIHSAPLIGVRQLDPIARARAEADLAKASFEATAQRLTVYDRAGKAVQTLGQPARYRWPAFSPDGTRIAFTRQDQTAGSYELYVLERATGSIVQLTSDSTGTSSPVWSPDATFIAYVSNRGGTPALYRRVATGTQDEELLFRLPGSAVVSDWSPDGRYLVFSLVDTTARDRLGDPLGIRAGLYVLRVEAGNPNQARTPIEVLTNKGSRILGARFSPDGRSLAYRSDQSGSNQIWVVRLDEAQRAIGEPRQVSMDGALGMATWKRDGKELYFLSADREPMVAAIRENRTPAFETPRRLFVAASTTLTSTLADYPFVGAPDGVGHISRDGREVVFVSVPEPSGASFPRQLTVFNRSGKIVRAIGAPANYSQPVFSPDGTHIAAYRDRALWVFEVSSGKSVRITPGGLAYSVVWSPDGRGVAYGSYRNDHSGVYWKAANGSGQEQLIYTHRESGAFIPLTDWSPDGRFLSFNGGNVAWTVSARGPNTFQLPPAEYGVFGARMSPDGRFVAYASDESGSKEIYVREFDAVDGFSRGAKWRVSDTGGIGMIQWRRDGRQLYYVAGDGGVMAVDVNTTQSFQSGSPRLLFGLSEMFRLDRTNYMNCSCNIVGGCEQGHISPDGEKFVFAVPMPPNRRTAIVGQSILARYAGTYTLGRADAVLTLEGSGLVFESGDIKSPLLAESESRLFLKTTNGDLEFFRDDRGNVSHFLFYTGGAPQLALRK